MGPRARRPASGCATTTTVGSAAHGARRRHVATTTGSPRRCSWRRSCPRRAGRVRYGNVREMDDGTLTVPGRMEWQVVLDYPFDDAGFGPANDVVRVERYRDERAGASRPNPTVVWLPTFFARAVEDGLG